MGKSPAKWIKTLFGKKPSKSNGAGGKGKTLLEKERIVTSKPRGIDNEQILSNSTINSAVKSETSSDVEKNMSNLVIDGGNKNIEAFVSHETLSDEENLKLQKSVTLVQAAFRGYLARRAFRTLRGIIRLQALIRGHLVRRQAVATLCCLFRIVKLQAVVRGRRVRSSYSARNIKFHQGSKSTSVNQVLTTLRIAKLCSNAFVRQLLGPSPTGMPLHLCYDSSEPNSVPIWLDRWSRSCFWKPLRFQTKPLPSKPHRKHSNGETEIGRPKRSVRRIPPGNFDNNSAQTSEHDRPKRIVRKVSTPNVENGQENPQSELEKVKRNLRKVQNPVTVEAAVVSQEAEAEKPSQNIEKVPKIGDNGFVKVKKEQKQSDAVLPETELLQSEVQQIPVLGLDSNGQSEDHEDKKEVIPVGEKCENDVLLNGDVNYKDEAINNEVLQKSEKKSGLKQERADSVPSYMAATESAKAKLRAQGSPGVNQENSDKSSSTRRHSLPSANSKAVSPSPRTQRSCSDRKSVSKTDKSSSRDVNGKPVQAEWKR